MPRLMGATVGASPLDFKSKIMKQKPYLTLDDVKRIAAAASGCCTNKAPCPR